MTPYQFASNRPIDAVDLDGGEAAHRIGDGIYAPLSDSSDHLRHSVPKGAYMPSVGAASGAAEIGKRMLIGVGVVAVGVAGSPYIFAAVRTVGLWAMGTGITAVSNPQLINEVGSFAVGLLDPGPGETNPNSSSDEIAKTLKGLAGKILFRGDSRSFAEIFGKGFESKGLNKDVMEYVEQNVPSIFVSASKSIEEAAAKAKGGYVYLIDNGTGSGLDVNNFYKALGEANPYAKELEVIFESKIDSDKIIGAVKISEDGKVDKTLILNPNYKPTKD